MLQRNRGTYAARNVVAEVHTVWREELGVERGVRLGRTSSDGAGHLKGRTSFLGHSEVSVEHHPGTA